MATLNLRDRLLETKIAYVGAALAGKATNFARLQGAQDEARAGLMRKEGGVLSLEWRPLHSAKFDDCELSVRLLSMEVGTEGGVESTFLSDVDGVVLVVDSSPGALEANRAATTALRSGLLGRAVPVVVQLNKRDLPDALSEEALVSALEITDWPSIAACASSGQGVVETVRGAIEGVVAMMKQGETETRRNGHARPSEPNPLLAALRGVLEGAIATEIHALEARLQERAIGRVAEISELRAELATLRREVADLEASSARGATRATAELAALSGAVSELQRAVTFVEMRLETMSTLVESACTKDELVLESGRRSAEIETAAQRQREQIVASLGAFQRTLDGALAEIRKSEQHVRASCDAQTVRMNAVVANVTGGHETVLASMSPVSADVSKIASAIEGLEPRLTRVIAERAQTTVAVLEASTTATVDAHARAVVADAQASTERLEAQATAMAAQLDELIEELKKRKKGWFS